MNSEANDGTVASGNDAAALVFVDAARASRVVAGLPAAARMVRELAAAGFAQTWLVIPKGELSPFARQEVERLAGSMEIRLSADTPKGALALDGEIWIAAEAIRDAALRSERTTLRLDRPGASRRILKATGKTSDGPVSRWLNRPISRAVSAILLYVSPAIRPVTVTWFNALLAAAMFAALALGGANGLVAGALLFHAASVLDGVDGEIARATFRSSASGAALDSAIDMITNLLFFIGVCINLWLAGDTAHALLGVWGVLLVVIGATAIARRGRNAPLTFDHVKHAYLDRFTGPLVRRLIRLGAILTSRDFFALLGVIVVLAGVPKAIPWILASLATIWIPFVFDVPNRVIAWFSVKRQLPTS